MRHLTTIFLLFVIFQLSGQNAPDFTITDSGGQSHTLYEDYLDKGTTVVIKFFFVQCPPCNAIAPNVQALYEDWGEGQGDVEFFELSTMSGDSNAEIIEYKNRHGITFPGAGGEGNALAAIAPYQAGTFGLFFGTPSFAVIAPDGSVVYNTGGAGTAGRITNLNAAIEATGAVGLGAPEPSVFNLSFTDPFGNADTESTIFLEDANNTNVSFPITGNTLEINDLASEYPGINNPVLRFRREGNAVERVTPLDLLIMRKHILAIAPVIDPAIIVAGDTNEDGVINPLDMLTMRKLLLNIITDFPEGNYKFLPAEVSLIINPGQTENINVTSVKMGDLNGI